MATASNPSPVPGMRLPPAGQGPMVNQGTPGSAVNPDGTPAGVPTGLPQFTSAMLNSNGESLSGRGSFAAPRVQTPIMNMPMSTYRGLQQAYPQGTMATVTAAQKGAAKASNISPDQAKLDGYMTQYMASRQAAQQQIQNQAAASLALLGQTRNAAASAVASLPAAFQGAYKDATGLLGSAGAAATGALPADVQAAVKGAMGPESQYLSASNAAQGSLNPVLNAGISAGANARVGNILSQMMGDEAGLNQQDMAFQQGQMNSQQGFMNQEQLNAQNAQYQSAATAAGQKDTYAQSAGFANDAALQSVATSGQYKNAVSYLMNGFAQGGNITFDATKIAQHIAQQPNGAAVLRALAANNMIPAPVVKAVGAA